jgi:hypothetical protein
MKMSWLDTSSVAVAMILLALRNSFPKALISVRYVGESETGSWYSLNDKTCMTEVEIRLDQLYTEASFHPEWYEVEIE